MTKTDYPEWVTDTYGDPPSVEKMADEILELHQIKDLLEDHLKSVDTETANLSQRIGRLQGKRIPNLVHMDMVKTMHDATLTVHMKRVPELKARLWIATRMMMLAALIMNVNIEINQGDDR
jgi:hypothetical protein